MKTVLILAISAATALISPAASAHDVPNMEHSHAFEQTAYGTSRQGHYVNGPQGSIIIWSARPHGSTQSGASQNARPRSFSPITQAPSNPFSRPDIKVKSAKDYGVTSNPDYGK